MNGGIPMDMQSERQREPGPSQPAQRLSPSPELASMPYLVVNPNSSSGSTGRNWPRLMERVRATLGEVEVGFTTRPMEAAELTRAALLAGHRTVLAVGGDGTLNEVINGFFDSDGSPVAVDAIVSLLPTGTGGDFRKTAGIPSDWNGALEHVAKAAPRSIDVGRVRFRDHEGREAVRYFLNIASFGVSGAVDEAVNRSGKWMGGRISFMLASLKALLSYRDARVRITVDDAPPEDVPVTTLSVCNGQYFGGGMWVSPDSRMDDGEFGCTLWSGYGVKDFVFKSRSLYSGEHRKWSGTRCFTARKLIAESDERVLLDIDGEQPGVLPATFDLLPNAVRLKA